MSPSSGFTHILLILQMHIGKNIIAFQFWQAIKSGDALLQIIDLKYEIFLACFQSPGLPVSSLMSLVLVN